MNILWRMRGVLAGALAAACMSSNALAADASYPDRPVNVVVGFAPGGTNDILGRLIASKLQEKLKQTFIVENRAGANSRIAAEHVARAEPDGYTLFVASSGVLTINPAVYAKLNYDPVGDFKPVALLSTFPLVVVGSKGLGVSSLAELTKAAAKRPDGTLNHGVGSSTFQLAAEYYASDARLPLVHVNYKGTGPVVTAMLGNEVDIGFVDIAAAISQIEAGKLDALAVTTAERSPILPNVPTIAESGVPGYDVPIWTALMVPAKTPDSVVQTLRTALTDILADPDTAEKYKPLGMTPGNADAPALQKRIEDDIARWTKVAKDANIKFN